MGLLDWFQPKLECPVGPATREWIDERWLWLEQEFGVERVRNATVVLPQAEFFPDPYHSTESDARRLLDRVCGYMGIEPDRIKMSLYDESDPLARNPNLAGQMQQGTAGLYHREGRHFRIWVEVANLHDPLAMVATMAHELGHVHLLGHARISRKAEDHEPLTDLLTVFLGLGIFTANSVIREQSWFDGNYSGWKIGRRGYLGMPEYGYAFARFARCRAEEAPPWASELRLDVRSAFKQAMRFLAAHDASERSALA